MGDIAQELRYARLNPSGEIIGASIYVIGRSRVSQGRICRQELLLVVKNA